MNEEIMNEIQPVRPKDQFTFSCRQCGACCRNIEGCVMVESLDAYRLARYLRTKGEPIEGIEDFLFRYCEPEPLTEEGFPIYMLKTKAPNGSCIFLMDGRCSVYPARTRTCRIYPLTVGPGERGRDFEYCLCLDRHRSHFTGSRVGSWRLPPLFCTIASTRRNPKPEIWQSSNGLFSKISTLVGPKY